MKQAKKAPTPSPLSRNLLAGAIALCGLGIWQQSAIAEGSRELVKNGGNRPYTEWRTNSTAGLVRRTVLKVYANAGEVINLGSSGVDVGSGNILLFDEIDNVNTSTPKLNCKTAQPGKGILNTRAKEIAGPLPVTGGYDPCVYTAPTSGVYQVVFYGPAGASSTANASIGNADSVIDTPLIGTNQRSSVSLWDITVRSNAASTVDLNGRVFADYVALFMGANNRFLKSELFILTQDGYRYSTNLGVGTGLDPNGFIFFSSSQGLLDSTGNLLYRSGRGTSNAMPVPLIGGVSIQPPVHRLFFNSPDNTAVIGLGVPTTAIAPAPASNFLFTGGTGGSGNQTPESVGGTFSFDAPQSGSYQIIIDTNNNGTYSVADGDRVLEGKTNSGFNTVAWDGTNGDGSVLPPRPGNAAYAARIILKGGEYHFPLIDAESGKDGFRIQMLNPPGAFSTGATATTVYFDERDYTTNGTPVTLGCSSPTVPICDGRAGVDSASGAHKFGTNTNNENDYGDQKVLDTWIYFPSSTVIAPLVITSTTTANVQGKKSVRFLTDTDSNNQVTVGDQVEYTITYSNLTPAATSDATSFVINDALPSQLTFASAAIVSQTTGNTITLNPSYAGSGALTNPGTLRQGDTITLKIVATINADNGGSAIANQASATFSTPDNPGATVGTVVTDADAAGATTNPPPVGSPFFQLVDDGVNSGNDPTNTADDDPTLITVVPPPPPSSLTADKSVALVDDRDNSGGTTPLASQTATPGDILEYTIALNNTSTAIAANNVVLTDAIPANTTYVPGTLQISAGANSGTKTDASGDDQAEISGSQITFRLGTGANATAGGTLGTTAPDNSATVKFRVQINDPLPNGITTVSNQAIASSTGVTNVNSNDPSTPAPADPTVTKISPRLRLVKRITGIRKAGSPTTTAVGGYNDLATDPNDNAPGWFGGSNSYLLGAITGAQIPTPTPGIPTPNDEVEYTIYFLSDGAGTAQDAAICDFVPVNQRYVSGSMQLNFNGATSAIADGVGTGPGSGFYTASFPTSCQGTNNSNGAAYFQIGNVPSVNETPTSSYGFIRFRATID